jgi:PAS domain S-box-containing protein
MSGVKVRTRAIMTIATPQASDPGSFAQAIQRLTVALGQTEEVRTVADLVCEFLLQAVDADYGVFAFKPASSEADLSFSRLFSDVPHNFDEVSIPGTVGALESMIGDFSGSVGVSRSASAFRRLKPGSPEVGAHLTVPLRSKDGILLGGLFLGRYRPVELEEDIQDRLLVLTTLLSSFLDYERLRVQTRKDKKAFEMAAVQSQYLAAIVMYSADAIISKNLDGIITSWNVGAEAMFGYTTDEVIGRSVTILFPENHLDEEQAIIERIRRGEMVDHYETVRMRKDGSLVNISLTVSPIVDHLGNVVGASKIARDITQRKQAETELRAIAIELAQYRDELEMRVAERTASLQEAVTQMEEFSYTVSHDLRAPLRGMSMYCEMLASDYREFLEDNPEANRYVQRILENSQRLDRMVQDVLTYGRVARSDLTLEPVALDQVVRDIVEHYPDLQQLSSQIDAKSLGEVVGNVTLLTQAISNLLVNATKFVREGEYPKIKVWSEQEGDNLKLLVQDNGIGVDPRYQHRLFTIFERINPELPYEGNGIGLAIVRRATERMGGSVGMSSDGANGSTFWIKLPAVHRTENDDSAG